MEFLIGGYLLIGALKALGRTVSNDPTIKPIWMLTDRNPVTWSLKLTVFVAMFMLFWPFQRRVE